MTALYMRCRRCETAYYGDPGSDRLCPVCLLAGVAAGSPEEEAGFWWAQGEEPEEYHGPFATAEEASEDARMGSDPSVDAGPVEVVSAKRDRVLLHGIFDVNDLYERVAEQNSELVDPDGDLVSADWTRQQEEELERELEKTLRAWMNRHQLWKAWALTGITPAAGSGEESPSTMTTVSPWIQTISGESVDLLDPRPGQISLSDIAAALSRIPRFNGHTSGGPWSVAEHSLLVADLVQFQDRGETSRDRLLGALLHDSHEAYIGDLVSPLKEAVRQLLPPGLDPVRLIVKGLDRAIERKFEFRLDDEDRELIRLADLQALRLERDHLMAGSLRPWGEGLPPPPEGFKMRRLRVGSWSAGLVETAFYDAVRRAERKDPE